MTSTKSVIPMGGVWSDFCSFIAYLDDTGLDTAVAAGIASLGSEFFPGYHRTSSGNDGLLQRRKYCAPDIK